MEKLEFYAQSIEGRRDNNEDAFLAIRLNEENTVLAVADGMGGAAAGEVASHIAIQTLHLYLQEQLEEINEASDFKGILLEAFNEIQRNICLQIGEHPEYQGMGTTLSVLWIYKIQYVWANLGDSRIYFLDDHQIKQITKDHTFIQDYEEQNGLPAPPEMVAQYGNYILRTLDGGNDVPDVFPSGKDFELLDHSCTFLLCSDGLIVNNLQSLEKHFYSVVMTNKSGKKASESLVNFAYQQGSTDNITVVLGEYGKLKKKFPFQKHLLNYALIAAITLIIALGGWVFKSGIISLDKEIQKTGSMNSITNDSSVNTSSDKNDQDNKTVEHQVQSDFSLANKNADMEDALSTRNNYPKYSPFTLGRKEEIQVAKKSKAFTFLPYDGIPKEQIKCYENVISGAESRIVKEIEIEPDEELSLDFRNLGLEKKKYKWEVNVITNSGDKIDGKIYRIVDIQFTK